MLMLDSEHINQVMLLVEEAAANQRHAEQGGGAQKRCTKGGQSSVPASHGGFGQTSGGRWILGASDWMRVGRRRGPQQDGRQGIGQREKQHKKRKQTEADQEGEQSERLNTDSYRPNTPDLRPRLPVSVTMVTFDLV